MPSISFTVPGRIHGKGRARATNRGGFIQLYTPTKTRNEEKMIATLAKAAMQSRGAKPLEGPLWLDVVIIQIPPKSWKRAERDAESWIVSGHDCDNSIKQISDSLNLIAYEDDRQIAKISAERRWHPCGPERIEVRISTLGKIGELDGQDMGPNS